MPNLTQPESKAIWLAWWSLKIPLGKWIKFVRFTHGQNDDRATYRTYNDEARRMGLWSNYGLSKDEEGRDIFTFADPVLPMMLNRCNENGYRTIVVDAPLPKGKRK